MAKEQKTPSLEASLAIIAEQLGKINENLKIINEREAVKQQENRKYIDKSPNITR